MWYTPGHESTHFYPPPDRKRSAFWMRSGGVGSLPRMHAWQSEDTLSRLVEQSWEKGDPDPKALVCYGVLWQKGAASEPIRKQMSLRFVTGRPVSEIATQFLDWCCTQLQAQGKTAWLLIWDNASWHYSKQVRTWIREHNQHVKQHGKGIRILPFFLPKQNPWLNLIEPKWVHGKRAVVEPKGLLTASQLLERICAHFGCAYESHLSLPEKAAGGDATFSPLSFVLPCLSREYLRQMAVLGESCGSLRERVR